MQPGLLLWQLSCQAVTSEQLANSGEEVTCDSHSIGLVAVHYRSAAGRALLEHGTLFKIVRCIWPAQLGLCMPFKVVRALKCHRAASGQHRWVCARLSGQAFQDRQSPEVSQGSIWPAQVGVSPGLGCCVGCVRVQQRLNSIGGLP